MFIVKMNLLMTILMMKMIKMSTMILMMNLMMKLICQPTPTLHKIYFSISNQYNPMIYHFSIAIVDSLHRLREAAQNRLVFVAHEPIVPTYRRPVMRRAPYQAVCLTIQPLICCEHYLRLNEVVFVLIQSLQQHHEDGDVF